MSVKCGLFGCLLVVLVPALCYSQDTFVASRATYYGSPDCYGTPCMLISSLCLVFTLILVKVFD